MSRKTSPVAGGDTAKIEQYNNLRDEAYASSMFLCIQQATPNLTLKVSPGSCYINGVRVDYAGGNSPSFTAPVTHPRIDLLTINSAGTLVRNAGVELASPVEPTCPVDEIPICLVYNRVGQTSIKETDDSSNGYVYKDVRNFLQTKHKKVRTLILPYTDIGDATSQYDTTTFSHLGIHDRLRFTYDGNGTNPNINATTFPIGTIVLIEDWANVSSRGYAIVSEVGSNYISVDYLNRTGSLSAETNITKGASGIFRKILNYTGHPTTRFDITNTAGTTYRYTWDNVGKDPGINTTSFPIGTRIEIKSVGASAMNSANQGYFTVTGSGANYFEVTNASGVAENDKTLGYSASGYLGYIRKAFTYTKTAGVKTVEVEILGGGGGSGYTSPTSGVTSSASCGCGGGYCKKVYNNNDLDTIEYYFIGISGEGGRSTGIGSITDGFGGHDSKFKGLTAPGGPTSLSTQPVSVLPTGGDLNITGEEGSGPLTALHHRKGGSTPFGFGIPRGQTDRTHAKPWFRYGCGSTACVNTYGAGTNTEGVPGEVGLAVITENF